MVEREFLSEELKESYDTEEMRVGTREFEEEDGTEYLGFCNLFWSLLTLK